MKVELSPPTIAALAALPPISGDRLDHQATRLIDALDRYKRALETKGILSPEATHAGETYDLVAKLYAPTLIAQLAHQLLECRG
jgi:hypothetical protein